jgi:Fe-S-cluster containining protein
MDSASRSTLNAPWYADGVQFMCLRCGRCCGGAPGYVWVSPRETHAIAEHLGMPVEQFMRQHTRRIGMRQSLLELPDGDCEFLVHEPDGQTSCAIHPVRPLQCRTWPFWKSNLGSQRAWENAARHCPGIGRGNHYSSRVIQDALQRNDAADLPL